MKVCGTILSVLMALTLLVQAPVLAQGADWETHYSKAAKAYDSHNLFEARHEFLLALKEAKDCQKHQELAQRLENLAGSYQSQEKQDLAQPLLKLARKLKTKFSTT